MFSNLWGELTDYQTDDLLHAARFWISKKTAEERKVILKETLKCFEQWKRGQADKNGKVVAFRALGLLGSPDGIKRNVDEVMPWECAGPLVSNIIDLAFHLWLEKEPSFLALLDKHDLTTVFAICGIVGAKDGERAPIESLIRLNGFLTEHLSAIAEIMSKLAAVGVDATKRRARQNAKLAIARKNSAINRKRKAEEKAADLQRMAFDYFRTYPDRDVSDAVSYLRDRFNYSRASIEERIKGVKTMAIRSLRTGTTKGP